MLQFTRRIGKSPAVDGGIASGAFGLPTDSALRFAILLVGRIAARRSDWRAKRPAGGGPKSVGQDGGDHSFGGADGKESQLFPSFSPIFAV